MREEWRVYANCDANQRFAEYLGEHPDAIFMRLYSDQLSRNQSFYDVEAIRSATDIVIYVNMSFTNFARLDLFRYSRNTIIFADSQTWEAYQNRFTSPPQPRDAEQIITVSFQGIPSAVPRESTPTAEMHGHIAMLEHEAKELSFECELAFWLNQKSGKRPTE